jgi:MATE family multidrug resistance protein
MFVPIAIVWWNSENILLSLNQEPQLAYQAGLFMKCLMVGAPAFIAFEATKKFLQAQGIMQASTYVLMIVSPLNLVLNYSFVYLPPFNLGFKGAPLATSLSYWLMFILLVCYIRFVKGREAWGGWTTECLHGWWPFLKLSIPSLLMITAEWWAFELSSLAASYLSTRDLAAQSILLTSGSATYTIPFGISVAASNRIGNALGEGNGRKAHLATRVALIFAVVFGCTNSFFFMAARERFGYLFTPDEDVAQLVSKIMPLCALFQITDGLAGVSGGAIRGMGRQSFAAWINLFSYYVVALPIGYFLAFKLDWDLSGLWFGLCIALFLVALASVIFLMCTNWDSEVKRAQARIHMEDDQDHHAAV